MPSVTSSPSTESISRAFAAAEQPDVPDSTVIAVQPNRFRRVLDSAEAQYCRAAAFLLPLVKLSKYSLGVALILCVTVIWVASSEWIQYIFGTLEYNKPFFLTYFNTTGFCLWNAGFLLSPRWRRTPWDEESRNQPICVEDARLEAKPQGNGEYEEEVALQVVDGNAADARGVTRRVVLPLPLSEDRNASVNLTLSCAVANCSVLQERRPGTLGALRPGSFSPPLQPYEASLTRSVGVVTLPSVPRGPFPTNEVSAGREGGQGSVLGDNDDVDIESDLGNTSGTIIATQVRMEDECRDYSLPTSFASSAREEVVSVMLTDDGDEGGEAAETADSRSQGAEQNAAAQPWDATRRATIISSALLQHDSLGVPHRRRYHQRARRQRVLRYSLRRIWTCGLYFCPLWFLANYLFNLSLSITSVASNTILSSTSSIWTLALSYILLRQKVGIHRIVAVALCVSGSIMVGLADKNSSSGHNTVGGDVVALLSAFFYAAYTSVLKWHLPEDERFAMGMVFGAVGVLNFLFLWPGLLILGVSGVEPFAWPSWRQFWPLLLNALIGTNLSDVLWARSVVLTSPVVATLGLSLTTPLAMVVDAIFKHAHFNGLYIAGAILVMVGFLLANLPIRINLGV
jgi:solute carrier family 35, member F5